MQTRSLGIISGADISTETIQGDDQVQYTIAIHSTHQIDDMGPSITEYRGADWPSQRGSIAVIWDDVHGLWGPVLFAAL